jgi:cytochrome c553
MMRRASFVSGATSHGAAALLAAILLLSASPVPAMSKGDRAFGEYLSAECVTCHLVSGKMVGAIPPIVGWPEDQFLAVMGAYRSKDRDNNVMQTIAAKLKDDELAALAAYFGSLKPKP